MSWEFSQERESKRLNVIYTSYMKKSRGVSSNLAFSSLIILLHQSIRGMKYNPYNERG